MKIALRYLCLMILTILISAPPGLWGAAGPTLRINCTLHSPYEAFFFRLVEEVCARNGVSVERNTPPVARALSNVNEGIDDGDGPRIAGLSSSYPNMVVVPEPFGDFVFGAFSRFRDIKIKGWESLAQLNVAYIHGWKIYEENVRATKSTTKVNNSQLLFQLLAAGRTDVVLMTRMGGYAVIRELGMKGIHFCDSPLAVMPNYLYLHRRHQELAPRFSSTLKEMKRDGTYDRLYREMISPYLQE